MVVCVCVWGGGGAFQCPIPYSTATLDIIRTHFAHPSLVRFQRTYDDGTFNRYSTAKTNNGSYPESRSWC